MINILLNIILIPAYGVAGAVFATGLVMVYMVLRQLYVVQKEVQIGPAFPVITKCFFFSLTAGFIAKGGAWLVLDHIVFNAVAYLIAFTALLAWIKPFTQEHRILISEKIVGIFKKPNETKYDLNYEVSFFVYNDSNQLVGKTNVKLNRSITSATSISLAERDQILEDLIYNSLKEFTLKIEENTKKYIKQYIL